MAPERIDDYELLCRIAAKRGWRVLLYTDGAPGRAYTFDNPPPQSQLALLELRNRGEMLARISLDDRDQLPDCAAAVLQRLVEVGYLGARAA